MRTRPDDPLGEGPPDAADGGHHGHDRDVARSGRAAAVLLGAVLAGSITAGCATAGPILGAGPSETQTRDVSAVSAVDLAASGTLVLTGGDSPALRITAGRDVIDHLTSDVNADRLTLGTDGPVHSVGRVRYDLVLPAAHVVELSGSGAA